MYKNIDIIIPNYNNANFLDQSIKSVINQTFKNWKIYIVDDSSTDNSKDILLKYKNNKKIKSFFLKKNLLLQVNELVRQYRPDHHGLIRY